MRPRAPDVGLAIQASGSRHVPDDEVVAVVPRPAVAHAEDADRPSRQGRVGEVGAELRSVAEQANRAALDGGSEGVAVGEGRRASTDAGDRAIDHAAENHSVRATIASVTVHVGIVEVVVRVDIRRRAKDAAYAVIRSLVC